MQIHLHTAVRRAWARRRRLDFLMLLAALVGVSGLWGFIELADAVQKGETRAIDEWLLRALRNPNDPSDPLGPIWLAESVRDLTALGSSSVVGLVVAAVLGLLFIVRKYRAASLVLGATVGGQLLCVLLKR